MKQIEKKLDELIRQGSGTEYNIILLIFIMSGVIGFALYEAISMAMKK